tara:strand:+ start:943 stop:1608 length:666 start_codon:yes stop_codon:yes gene_type:complete
MDFTRIINKEFKIASRSGYESFMPIIYLFIIMIFFNISISYVSKNIILELVPLMIWVSCLLICILNLETIFKEDFEDGTLEESLVDDTSQEESVAAKILSHWLLSNFPVVIIAPLIAILLGISYHTSLVLFFSLLIGTPTMSLLGSIAAALTVSLKRNKILMSVIVLPLYVPILIFGTSAVNNAHIGANYHSELYLMGILFLLFSLIAPTACVKALKVSLD